VKVTFGYGTLSCPQPGQDGTKKVLSCPGNYKQCACPKKGQVPYHKLQIPNKGVSCGQILNAFGEAHTAAFFLFRLSLFLSELLLEMTEERGTNRFAILEGIVDKLKSSIDDRDIQNIINIVTPF
jgi:hypothetical protein